MQGLRPAAATVRARAERSDNDPISRRRSEPYREAVVEALGRGRNATDPQVPDYRRPPPSGRGDTPSDTRPEIAEASAANLA